MVNSESSSASSTYQAARLERALPRIEREWLPFNRPHLERIISAFKAGAYEIDPERLVEELAQDVGAITWLIHQASLQGYRGGSPLEIVQDLTPAKAIELLEQRKGETHSLERSSDEQLTVLRTSSVALGAAAGFAPSTDVSIRDAIGAELVLQIGRLLVAWNYPLAFARAADGDQSRSIDERIETEIGFSPLMLSHLLAEKWRLNDRFARLTDSQVIEENHRSLARLCEISEALAVAEAPEFFPDAQERFEMASEAVRETLGPLGLKTLATQVDEAVAPYRKLLGARFSDSESIELGSALKQVSAVSNAALSMLSGSRVEVRAAVREILDSIESRAVDVGAAKRAMDSLVPLCGFSAGCIFVFDPFAQVFRQRLNTGTWHRALAPVINQLAPGDIALQISGGFASNQIQVSNGDTFDTPSFLVAPLGSASRIGVLCFEASLLSIDDSGAALSHAKAIRLVVERALKA